MKRKVLFLCTGNSCRSQMAEAIVNARLGGTWEAYSAGTRPTNSIHPKTFTVLAEIGIQHNGSPKNVDAFRGTDFDLVVTLCNSAAEECPVWLGRGKRIHRDFPDPVKAEGTDGDVVEVFRKVRDGIFDEILPLLETQF